MSRGLGETQRWVLNYLQWLDKDCVVGVYRIAEARYSPRVDPPIAGIVGASAAELAAAQAAQQEAVRLAEGWKPTRAQVQTVRNAVNRLIDAGLVKVKVSNPQALLPPWQRRSDVPRQGAVSVALSPAGQRLARQQYEAVRARVVLDH